MVNHNEVLFGFSKSPQESLEKATELLQKVLAIDDNDPDAHGVLAKVFTRKKEYDKAVAEGERASPSTQAQVGQSLDMRKL